ncbi:MAG: DUF3800 domain-containing protein [Ktedonobacteraceae bacterium]
MSTIFLDESGFTGQDLLNSEQPVFTVATLNYSEVTCRQLKASFFQNVRAVELMHSALRKSPGQQRMVLAFLKELSRDVASIKISLVHKRYALTAKLVDLVAEPAASEAGFNFYEDDAASSFANLLFYVLPAIGGEDFYRGLLERFQNMLRRLDRESYDRFFQPLFDEKYPDEIDDLLWAFRACHLDIGYDLLRRIKISYDHFGLGSSGPLDVGLTCTLGLMMKWRAQLSDAITLIHDDSSRMASEEHIWKALVSPNTPAATFGDGQRKWVFPNVIEGTLLESSGDWVGLQLADVVAGATTQWAKWIIEGQNREDEYAINLDAVVPSLLVDADRIWPTLDYAPRKGFDASTSLDYFSQLLMDMDGEQAKQGSLEEIDANIHER